MNNQIRSVSNIDSIYGSTLSPNPNHNNRAKTTQHFKQSGRKSTNADFYHLAPRSVFSSRSKSVTFGINSKSALSFYRRSKSVLSTIKSEEDIEDESKPNKSFLVLLRLVCLTLGLEALFCLQEALAVPLLLKLRVPEQVYSLVYMFSPLLGVFLQPILGAMSDRCESRFGRRKPFIFVLTLFSLAGLLLILNGSELGKLLGDNLGRTQIGIIITCIGVTFLNFSADSADAPLRALIIDICNSSDQDTAFNMHAFISGIGSSLGFILGAVNWKSTFLKVIGDNTQILSIYSLIIMILCLVTTLTAVKETPYILPQNENTPLIDINAITALPEDLHESMEENEDESLENIKNEEDEEEDNDIDEPITLKLLYKSVLKMPKELFRLLGHIEAFKKKLIYLYINLISKIVAQVLGWMTIFSISLFFTDFMAQSIYKGDPNAPSNSTSFMLYDEGVRMGCWCLLAIGIVSAVSAVILEKFLINILSTKTLYFFSHFIHAVCIGGSYFVTNAYFILALSSSLGIVITANYTLPYQLVSEFHEDKEYRKKSPPGTKRGIGTDCALLSSLYFFAQFLIAAFTGLLTTSLGNNVILLTSSIMALLLCLWVSVFMIFPKKETEK